MPAARLTSLKLTAFKSFIGQELPLGDLTILTGRNSSGKSNALDGLEVLSRLVTGEDIGDALDGRRREGGPIRGGSAGCAPHATDSFELGCAVNHEGDSFEYRVRIQVRPDIRVTREWLTGPGTAVKSGTTVRCELFTGWSGGADSPGIVAEIHNGKRGVNPASVFRDSRLVLTQLPLRMSPKNAAERSVLRGVAAVTSALRGVFHLDPVPHLMRDYVTERDVELRRTGANLSAAIAHLKTTEPDRYAQVLDLVQDISDSTIVDMTVERTPLGDVMLALQEGTEAVETTPAREMSDGLLRFIAIATALLATQKNLDLDVHEDVAVPPEEAEPGGGSVAIVIEEIENGLHPSQADRVLELVENASAELNTQVLLTTHSPALLNVLTGHRNDSVVVCYRDPATGKSRLTRMTDLPGYAEAMASGNIGDLVSRDQLVRPQERGTDWASFNSLIGLA